MTLVFGLNWCGS